MAAPTHKPSRRALLGAVVALPVLSLAEAPLLGGARLPIQSPPRSGLLRSAHNDDADRAAERWRRALGVFEAAEAEVHAFERRTAGAPWEEQDAIEEAYGGRLDAMYAALRRLLRLPAPDFQAFLTKVALVTDHEVATLEGGEACMAALKRDIGRYRGR